VCPRRAAPDKWGQVRTGPDPTTGRSAAPGHRGTTVSGAQCLGYADSWPGASGRQRQHRCRNPEPGFNHSGRCARAHPTAIRARPDTAHTLRLRSRHRPARTLDPMRSQFDRRPNNRHPDSRAVHPYRSH